VVRRNFLRVAALTLCIFSCASSSAANTALWQQLKQGGYVILMRHAAVDSMTHSTHPNANFENCASQNNLSPQGQQDAATVGRVFKQQQIPIAAVLAGPYCRTQDTARIAFGAAQVWTALDLQTDLPEDEASKRMQEVYARIAQFKGTGNLVLLTHQLNIDALTLELVEPSTVLILKPEGAAGFTVLGHIPLSELP
jgi:phosphohistidine phosphatase SixA